MKNKKKTKKMNIEETKDLKNLFTYKNLVLILIPIVTGLLFAIDFELSQINKNIKIQTETLIQISDFLQNRFEIEKPSPQMVEIVGLK